MSSHSTLKKNVHQKMRQGKETAKKALLKTLDETLDDNLEKLPQTLSENLSKKLPDIPVVGAYLPDRANQSLKKFTETTTKKAVNTFSKQAKKLTKRQTDIDVLIIGAGMSGVAMATKLKKSRPFDKVVLLERRADMGGTWDLFNYPGIRSDSDVTTFGFADHPWHGNQTLASGEAIKSYIKDTANNTGINKYIRYEKSVESLNWSSVDSLWSVTIRDVASNDIEVLTSKFVVGATGYYDFSQGYQPTFEGQENFNGAIIHPQNWQKNLDYHGKKIVIIGSGATAVTLMPALLDANASQQASHVTMLQRRPTYIASVSSEDNTVELLSEKWGILSKENAYELKRWKNILIQQGSYRLAKKAPKAMKALLKHGVKKETKGSGVSLKHFSPDYRPWDERVCAVPDGDLFKQLQTGHADIVTDHIERFTETGIELKSGKHLDADIIITATGLNLQMLGGASLSIDGEQVKVAKKMTYKAVLVEDIPNMAVMFGYTNASWTLKIDIATIYVTRLLNYMTKHGYKVVTAKSTTIENKENPDGENDIQKAQIQEDNTVMGALSAGYVQRAVDVLPKQGDCYPWYVTNNYLSDRIMLLHRKIKDNWLRFER